MKVIRTTALTTALIAVAVPSLTSSAQAWRGWRGGWGWRGAALGAAAVGTALAARSYYGYGYGYPAYGYGYGTGYGYPAYGYGYGTGYGYPAYGYGYGTGYGYPASTVQPSMAQPPMAQPSSDYASAYQTYQPSTSYGYGYGAAYAALGLPLGTGTERSTHIGGFMGTTRATDWPFNATSCCAAKRERDPAQGRVSFAIHVQPLTFVTTGGGGCSFADVRPHQTNCESSKEGTKTSL